MKRILAMLLCVVCFMGCLCFTGCNKEIDQPSDSIYLVLEDTRGNVFHVHSLYTESDYGLQTKTVKRQLYYEQNYEKKVTISIRGLYDSEGKMLEEKYYQHAREELTYWEIPLDEIKTHHLQKHYYINRYNEKGELYHYILAFEIEVSVMNF